MKGTLSSLLENAAAFGRTIAEARPVTTLTEDTTVNADPQRIGQVLRNLVSNAVRYTSSGTPIELRATRMHSKVRVEVADRGVGISEPDLGVIFEKFARGHGQLEDSMSGSGLGLYISRRIVRAHGSELEVASVPGEGSVFAFELEVIA